MIMNILFHNHLSFCFQFDEADSQQFLRTSEFNIALTKAQLELQGNAMHGFLCNPTPPKGWE